MQLTDQQLDAAAQRLCELWGQNPEDTVLSVTLRVYNASLIRQLLNTKGHYIEAIIHAVTSE